jgi:hypothetical protein
MKDTNKIVVYIKITKLLALVLFIVSIYEFNLNSEITKSNNGTVSVTGGKNSYVPFPITVEDVQLKLATDFEFISSGTIKSGNFNGFIKNIFHIYNNKLPRVEIITEEDKIYCFNRIVAPKAINVVDLQMGDSIIPWIAITNFTDVEMLTGNKYLGTMDNSQIRTFMLLAKACWTSIKNRTSKREKYSLGDTVILLSNVLDGIEVSYMTVNTWKVIRSKLDCTLVTGQYNS